MDGTYQQKINGVDVVIRVHEYDSGGKRCARCNGLFVAPYVKGTSQDIQYIVKAGILESIAQQIDASMEFNEECQRKDERDSQPDGPVAESGAGYKLNHGDFYETCPTCSGSGEGMHEGQVCVACKGEGEVERE